MGLENKFDATQFLKTLTHKPGVYRMYSESDEVIYVGKAKNLKKRVSSYFRTNVDSAKTRALVKHIARIEITIVNTESEAFLLENNFIKKYKPRYNVVMRDDKSYPYIHVSDHSHPRLSFHRGNKKNKGDYFGPYPSSWAVRESLRTMQKIFPVRQCEDSYYRARSRPCLQYQMQRCSAPCVKGYVSDQEYAEQVDWVKLFLQGKNDQIISRLVNKMEVASEALNFEAAARYRDQIAALQKVQQQHAVSASVKDMDVFGIATRGNMACVHVIFIREGQMLGSKSYFPRVPANDSQETIFQSFFLQFYLARNKPIPRQIVVPCDLEDEDAIVDVLCEEAKHNIKLFKGTREQKRRYLQLANDNAQNALDVQYAQHKSVHARYLALEEALELNKPIKRMECFDISHTSGQQTVASCVVFDRDGPKKSDYRRYNIDGITPGDDYAAMDQVLKRRYKSAEEAQNLPDIVVIDGGKGQLSQAESHFNQWPNDMTPMIIGVAKGTSRKPGLETLILGYSHDTIAIESHSPGLHLIQHIRDESHRFAITGHRQRRQKAKNTSTLEHIPGVGSKRRQLLIKYMGGLQGLKQASAEEIAKVPGISHQMATVIYEHLQVE